MVPQPTNQKIIKSKWVFDIKSDKHYKARLVAKGFTQVQGIDYQEAFSPVTQYEVVRYLTAIAVLEDWELCAFDIKTAFLYGILNEEIYIEQPEGFLEKGQESHVCRLKKAIYGLKQASRTWNHRLHAKLLDIGFKRTYSDVSVYMYQQQGGDLILIVYVDDLLAAGPHLNVITDVHKSLASEFKLRDFGDVNECLPWYPLYP